MLNSTTSSAFLDIIIPLKDRKEVKQCVNSLLVAQNIIRKIMLIDGGSTEPNCLKVLNELAKNPLLTIIKLPELGFNKSRLLNYGIKNSLSELLLISDADIIWNLKTLQDLITTVLSSSQIICSIREVQETQLNPVALSRPRYTYQIDYQEDTAILRIISASLSQKRPGCGLICAKRSSFLSIGGYQEKFKGWGWEDQDFLIRARLLGLKIHTEGQVLHLSHSDHQRNLHNDCSSPILTRNRNIMTSVKSLKQGNFWGSLLNNNSYLSCPKQIRILQIELPEELQELEKHYMNEK